MSSTIEPVQSTPKSTGSSPQPRRKSTPSNRVAGVVLAILLIGGAVFAASTLIRPPASAVDPSILTTEAQRDDLLITVTEEGNVESALNTEVKCEVAGGSSILWIVEDGKRVNEGELLVQLDASVLEEQINTQRIAFEKARATKIQSEKNLAVAEISVQEYLEGTYKQEIQIADANVTIAEENLRSAQNTLQYAEKMFRKGYVSTLELESQRFGVERANLELGSVKTAREVLEKFTRLKMIEDLRSQVANAKAQLQSDEAGFELEELRLNRLEEQIKSCKINAPQSGMVVYANERGGRFGQSQASIEEGAVVRERQTILRLPDLEQMQVKVNVHESKVDQIAPGMRARVRILNQEVRGNVTSVANQPEPSSWFSGNVKEYATLVRIDSDEEMGLRPGMTAEVEILVAHLKNVLVLPVAAVIETRGNYVCWVQTANEPEKRPLVIGRTNDQFVEIIDGVAEGDVVLLNPRAVVKEARELETPEDEIDVNQRFGADAGERGPGPGRPGRDGPPGEQGTKSRGPGGGGMERGGPERGGPERETGGPPSGGRDRADSPRGDSQRADAPRGAAGGGMAQIDKDGDGKVSKDEAPAMMKGNFDKIDSNGNGFLDGDEMRSFFQQRGAQGRPAP